MQVYQSIYQQHNHNKFKCVSFHPITYYTISDATFCIHALHQKEDCATCH